MILETQVEKCNTRQLILAPKIQTFEKSLYGIRRATVRGAKRRSDRYANSLPCPCVRDVNLGADADPDPRPAPDGCEHSGRQAGGQGMLRRAI